MEIATTISSYMKSGFSYEDIMKILISSGIKVLDFPYHAEGYYKANKHHFEAIKEKANEYGVSFNQVHAPYKTKIDDNSEIDILAEKTISCIKFSKILGAKTMVVHPLQHLVYSENADELLELNFNFFKTIIPYAEEYNIQIALENLWQRDKNGKIVPSICGSPAEYLKYLNMLDSDNVCACLDIGHAVLCKEDPVDFIMHLGNKLQALHIHENDQKNDLHTLPFVYGTIDWKAVIDALNKVGYIGDLTFETVGYLEKHTPELLGVATTIMAGIGEELASMNCN